MMIFVQKFKQFLYGNIYKSSICIEAMIQNPFRNNQKLFCCQSRNKFNKINNQSKTDRINIANPFLRQSLIPVNKIKIVSHSSTFSQSSHHFNQRSHSSSNTNSQSHNFSRKTQSTTKRSPSTIPSSQQLSERFIRKKQLEVQRKRINMFGAEIMRYKPIAQQKNSEYFKTKSQEQLIKNNKNDKSNVFKESSNIYSSHINGNIKMKQNQHPIQRERRHKAKSNIDIVSQFRKSKTKKMLSWNIQLPSQKLKNKQKRISENESRISNEDNKYTNHRFGNNDISPSFGAIRFDQNYSQSESNSKKSQYNNIQNQRQRQNYQRNDYVMQLSDGFRIQSASPSSSFSSIADFNNNKNNPYASSSGPLFSRGNYYNMTYCSNFRQSQTEEKLNNKQYQQIYLKSSAYKKSALKINNNDPNCGNFRRSNDTPQQIKYKEKIFQLILI